MKTLRKILLCSLLCTFLISCSHDTPHLTEAEINEAMATVNELIMRDGYIYFANDSEVGCTSFEKYIAEKGIDGIKNHPALKGITAIEEKDPAPQGSIIISKVYDNIYNDVAYDEHKTCVYSNIRFTYTYSDGETSGKADFYLNGKYTESTTFSHNNKYEAYEISTMNINGTVYKPLTIVYNYPERGNHYYISELVFNSKPATGSQLNALNKKLGYI